MGDEPDNQSFDLLGSRSTPEKRLKGWADYQAKLSQNNLSKDEVKKIEQSS